MRKIICIGRQFGSGGHYIARQAAARLGIAYYDKKLFDEAVQAGVLSQKVLKQAEEQTAHPLLQPIYFEGGRKEYYGKNANDILFELQKERILEYASHSDCVIVGRCADDILKNETDYAVKSIFMTAPMEARIHSTMKIDALDEKAAAAKVRKADKKRSAYYNYYTSRDWGKPSDYDLCMNTCSNQEDFLIEILCGIYKSMG
ncbi:MAG: cytidylate kinase-like family protein [Lachnospiraceae bacterium]|nr:cytidylate kinase-like family protein [Lachnospiraceae bacterium]